MNENFVKHYSTMKIMCWLVFISFFLSNLYLLISKKEEDNNLIKKRKNGLYLPPDDFVYGIKHPKQTNITGVAAGKYPINFFILSSELFY